MRLDIRAAVDDDGSPQWGESEDAAEIRYSLTALGEALVREPSRRRWRGFGPCSVATPDGGALHERDTRLTLARRT